MSAELTAALYVVLGSLGLGVGIGIGVALGMELCMRLSGSERSIILTFARTKRDQDAPN